jgi:hypothetical protein
MLRPGAKCKSAINPEGDSKMSHSTIGILISMVLIGVTGTYASRKLSIEIKARYPAIWKKAGHPSVTFVPKFKPWTILDEWRFNCFIWLRKYRLFDEKKLRSLGDVVLVCMGINLILFVYLVVFRYSEFSGPLE